MPSRTTMITAVLAATASLAAVSTAAVASTGTAPAKTMSAGRNPAGSKPAFSSKAAEERQGHDAIVAAVASTLHVSAAQVSAALQPIFAAGYADPSSPLFAGAARALGVSTADLNSALVHAKLSQTAAVHARQVANAQGAQDAGAKSAAAGAAAERQGHAAITAAVAHALQLSSARVSAALQPIFAAGHADTSSPAFAAAARALGVSTAQLDAALRAGKQSLAQGQ